MIFTIIERCRQRRPHKVRFSLPVYFFPTKGLIMSDTLNLPNDAVATVALVLTDRFGNKVAPVAALTGSVSVADPTIATAVLNTDDTVTVTPVSSTGTTVVTYTDPVLPPATMDVVLELPVATSIGFDVADATFVPKVAAPVAPVSGATAAASLA